MEQAPRDKLLKADKIEAATVSAWVGPKGEKLRLRGHTLDIPKGAVPERTLFTMEEPNSDVIKVVIRANDQEHYEFANKVYPTLTLSYAERAGDAKPEKGRTFAIYRVDECSSEIDKRLKSGHEAEKKRVSATLETLSGYAVGSTRAESVA